jgi:Ala-tRNA(Pro) deacylase
MDKEFFEIRSFLDRQKAAYEVFEHEPVYTSEQAAQVRGEELKTGVKSLVFKADQEFILILVPGDKRADMNKIRNITGKRNIRMATKEEVLQVCNCEIGSVHPFGNLMKIKTYMDHTILQNDHVNFNVGLHTMTVRMSPLVLKNLVNPEVVDLVKE